MRTRATTLALIASACILGACATHDHQDTYLFGAANAKNIALQSERDVNLPNSKAVETTSGVRAAQAVKALNEGKTKELRQASAGAGGDS